MNSLGVRQEHAPPSSTPPRRPRAPRARPPRRRGTHARPRPHHVAPAGWASSPGTARARPPRERGTAVKTVSALLHSQPGRYEPTEVDLDGPRRGELLVRMVAPGLCPTDDHGAVGDSPAFRLPIAGGHEGAGVVEVGRAHV